MTDVQNVPLGFWLRRVNTVARAEPATPDDCARALAMFVPAGGEAIAGLLDRLRDRGWAEQTIDARWVLTPSGRAALARLEGIVAEHRARMFAGVSDEDYRITVESLAQITVNLDPQDESVKLFGRG